MKRRAIYTIGAPVAALLFSVAVSSVVLLLGGYNPVEAFQAMWTYIDSLDSVVAIVNRAVPYYVAGVAVAIGFKMGLFNIGADGQYRIAAVVAAWAGAEVGLPRPLPVGFVLLVAMVAGAAWAGIAAVLKVTRGVNEVVSTIMLNYIATGLTAYLLANYFRDDVGNLVTQTKELPTSAWLPDLNRLLSWFGLDLPDGTRLFGFLPLAIAVGVGFYLLVWRTRFGFELRTTGVNPAAALAAGVNPKAMVLKTFLLSGAVAGLIGMAPLLTDFHKYADQFPTGLAFTGISVALLGRNSPVGIVFGALVFAGIERASQILNTIDIPQEIGRILQGTILLSAVIAYEVARRLAEAAAVKDAAARAAARESSTPAATPSPPSPPAQAGASA